MLDFRWCASTDCDGVLYAETYYSSYRRPATYSREWATVTWWSSPFPPHRGQTAKSDCFCQNLFSWFLFLAWKKEAMMILSPFEFSVAPWPWPQALCKTLTSWLKVFQAVHLSLRQSLPLFASRFVPCHLCHAEDSSFPLVDAHPTSALHRDKVRISKLWKITGGCCC